ncbi:ABC-three component system middle component 7 [Sporolactobacillus inulinus]
MRLPSKVTSYKESSLSKFPVILETINKNSMSPYELYEDLKKHFDNIEDFIETLDYLYALNKIFFETENGRITNVI